MPRDGLPQQGNAAAELAGCLPRGYRLNEFVIDRVIAEGGFGVVYSALDLRLKRRVAIKEYMPALLARRAGDFSVQPRSSVRHQDAFAVGLRSFINEARLLAQFDHPSLVRVHQFWEDKGTGFIVMPLYEGPTLKQWLAHNPPPDEAWLRGFLDRMLDVLAMLHAADCLHRDIAPDNILVMRDGAPLLLDFGAARRVIDELTQTLTVILKPGYAPIEQYAAVAGIRQGPWTDLYALCATAHAVVLRQPPPPAVARAVRDEMRPLAEAAAGRYSHALLAALDAGLAVRPEHRPPSADALRALIGAGARDDADRTVLLPADTAATAQDAASAAARATPAPSTAAADCAPAAPAPRAAAPAPAPTPALPAASHRRSRVFELLFERPLGAREALCAIAAAMVGFGTVAWRVLEVDATPDTPRAGIEGQVKPIVRAAPAQQPSAPAPEVIAPALAAGLAAPPHVALDPRPPVAALPTRPRVAPVRAARAPKPGAASPLAAAESQRAPAAGAAPATAAERPDARRDDSAAAPAGAAPGAVRSAAPEAELPAPDRNVPTVEVAAARQPAPSTQPPPPAALVPIAQPRPRFAAGAVRDGITQGRVLARLSVDADGRVTDARIVESSPRRVFDREVRQAALRWRYRPPGEPREIDVEFVFRLDD